MQHGSNLCFARFPAVGVGLLLPAWLAWWISSLCGGIACYCWCKHTCCWSLCLPRVYIASTAAQIWARVLAAAAMRVTAMDEHVHPYSCCVVLHAGLAAFLCWWCHACIGCACATLVFGAMLNRISLLAF